MRVSSMAPGSEDDDPNDVAYSHSLTKETSVTKRQRLSTSTGTLVSPYLSLFSSSDHQGDSAHAPPLPTLHFDLVPEILCRLPVKYLLQLRCVCKSWNSLISDPKFAKKHLLTCHRHRLMVSSVDSSGMLPELWDSPISSVYSAVSTSVTQTQLRYPLNLKMGDIPLNSCSCDGIFCFPVNERCALLWNPSIRKFKISPLLDIPTQNSVTTHVRTVYSFGYDRIRDNYKIVAVVVFNAVIKEYQVRVHTLGTNSWRRIPDFPYDFPGNGPGKFVSGTVNWLIRGASTSWVVASLDLGNESYQELLPPDFGELHVLTLNLGVIMGCLCISTLSDTFISNVWIMKDYGNRESWTKFLSFPMQYSPSCNPSHIFEDDQLILLDCMSSLVVYDFRNGTSWVPIIQNINGWMRPQVYVESLISPCS